MNAVRFITLATILLCTTVAPHAHAQDTELTECRSTLFRLIGSTNAYLWVCRCERDGRRVAFGRATYVLPAWARRSVQKHKAFVQCQNKRRRQLEHTCLNNREHYEDQAERAMHVCSTSKFVDNDAAKKIQSPFKLEKGTCFTEFVGLFSPTQTNGLWACVCRQRYVEVVVARAQFSSVGAPDGSQAEEVQQLEACTKGLETELNRVCLNVPGDFELLALHNLQTCCKRVRKDSDSKFQCDAFVPKNVDALKPKDIAIV